MKPTYIHITTDHSDDSLFGPESPPDVEYNPDELLDTLRTSILKCFPELLPNRITVTEGEGHTTVDTDGNQDDIETIVADLIYTTWESWIEQFET